MYKTKSQKKTFAGDMPLGAPEHQPLRPCIYREQVFWIYTDLQCKERGPLPSYLVLKVRATFPPTQDEELFADWLTGLWESWRNHVVNCEEILGLNETWDKPWIVLLVRLLTSAYGIERPLALFSSILQLSANYNQGKILFSLISDQLKVQPIQWLMSRPPFSD